MKLTYKFLNKPLYKFNGEWILGRRKYNLIHSVDIVINEIVYTIPKEFEWDGWSIPPIIYNFFDLTYDLVPSLVHDYFYETAGTYSSISRKVADNLLKQIALDRDCQKREVYMAYWVVRLLSGSIWRKNKRKNKGLQNDNKNS